MTEKKVDEKKAEDKKKHTPKAHESSKSHEAELKETLQRVQAEFENYRKRVEKEKEEFAKIASSGIIKRILPILDNFEVALKNKPSGEDFAKGIEMIYAQLFTELETAGLKGLDAEGKMFDPYLHEALMQQESDKEDGTVIEVFQKGYTLNGQVIRHSKVKVSKRGKK